MSFGKLIKMVFFGAVIIASFGLVSKGDWMFYFKGAHGTVCNMIQSASGFHSMKLNLSECVTDVVELKNGNSITGKILKETPGSILIRNATETMETSVLRQQIVSIRKATADDIKAVQDEIVKAREAAKQASFFEKERAARLKGYYEERNARETAAAAAGGRSQSRSVEAMRDAKDKGQVIQGMSVSDVLEVYGQPDSKARDIKGNAEREKWTYSSGVKQCEVVFYKGKVE